MCPFWVFYLGGSGRIGGCLGVVGVWPWVVLCCGRGCLGHGNERRRCAGLGVVWGGGDPDLTLKIGGIATAWS